MVSPPQWEELMKHGPTDSEAPLLAPASVTDTPLISLLTPATAFTVEVERISRLRRLQPDEGLVALD
jgi:hypothetical protein